MGKIGEYNGYALKIKNSVLSEYRMLKNSIPGCDDGNGVYVKHADCKVWMEFKGDKWICPICGGKLLKSVAYDYINELNQQFYDEIEDADYDDYW